MPRIQRCTPLGNHRKASPPIEGTGRGARRRIADGAYGGAPEDCGWGARSRDRTARGLGGTAQWASELVVADEAVTLRVLP